jgi:periplasmic protein TonB
MNIFASLRVWLSPQGLRLAAGISLLLAGCTTPPEPLPEPEPEPPEVVIAPVVVAPPEDLPTFVSQAATPRDYRRDAASHLYEQNLKRVYRGKMPPLLYAVGVLQVEVDGRGQVTSTSWMRAPIHAPEVIAEIERTVRMAAPYPAPVRMGHVTYTDTWLWHKSGLFQLDTLTEGQL